MTLESKLKPSMGSRLCHLNQVIEEDIDDLQERLARAVQAKELLEAQLFVPPPASTTSPLEWSSNFNVQFRVAIGKVK